MAYCMTLKYGAADATVTNDRGKHKDRRHHRKYAEVAWAEKARQRYNSCQVNKQLGSLPKHCEGHATRGGAAKARGLTILHCFVIVSG